MSLFSRLCLGGPVSPKEWQWIAELWGGSYSIGGGAVAPVPQGAAPPKPADPRPTEFGDGRDLADAALSWFLQWQPGQPEHYLGKLLAGTPDATAGAIERAIRTRNAERETRLDIEHLSVGLRAWGVDGLVFLVEGCRR